MSQQGGRKGKNGEQQIIRKINMDGIGCNKKRDRVRMELEWELRRQSYHDQINNLISTC